MSVDETRLQERLELEAEGEAAGAIGAGFFAHLLRRLKQLGAATLANKTRLDELEAAIATLEERLAAVEKLSGGATRSTR